MNFAKTYFSITEKIIFSIFTWNISQGQNDKNLWLFILVTHFTPMFHFYTPWQCHETSGSLSFQGYRNGIRVKNWSIATMGNDSELEHMYFHKKKKMLMSRFFSTLPVLNLRHFYGREIFLTQKLRKIKWEFPANSLNEYSWYILNTYKFSLTQLTENLESDYLIKPVSVL